MKWVKCVYNGDNNHLTIGKIYKVINHFPGRNERVEIIKDNNVLRDFYLRDIDGMWHEDATEINQLVWFEDADAEVRDNKINQIIKR